MKANDMTYKTFTINMETKQGIQTLEIVACDLQAAQSDFDQAFGIANAVGPWGCKEGWA